MVHAVTGKVVAVTGASRGIGAAAVREFAALGAKVVLLARGSKAIAELAAEFGDTALAVPCDVARYHEVEAAFATAVKTFGSLDIVINNAGVIEPVTRLEDSDPDTWGQVIDINLKGTFNGVRAALPHMADRGGTIIGISSGAATSALEGWSHYCSSKAAARMLTQCLHKEMAGKGIRALGLSPGTVATQMQREIKASGVNPVSELDWEDHIPPEWAARTLVWMCTPEADTYLGVDVKLRDEALRAKVGLL